MNSTQLSNEKCVLQLLNKNEQKIDISKNACDESTLRAIKRQLEMHERLNKRFSSGELSQSNIFCRHLETMRETRKNLMNQLDQIKLSMDIQH